LIKIYQDYINNGGKSGDYSLMHEVLIWKGKIMFPKEKELIKMIL